MPQSILPTNPLDEGPPAGDIKEGVKVGLRRCQGSTPAQQFEFTTLGHLRIGNNLCVDKDLVLRACSSKYKSQKWRKIPITSKYFSLGTGGNCLDKGVGMYGCYD